MDKADADDVGINMLSIDEIENTILDLENHDTTFSTCEKLAWLYIVKDHIKPNVTQMVSNNSIAVNGSEFLDTISNKNMTDVMQILDEHMQVIQLLHPKEYRSLIEKLNKIK